MKKSNSGMHTISTKWGPLTIQWKDRLLEKIFFGSCVKNDILPAYLKNLLNWLVDPVSKKPDISLNSMHITPFQKKVYMAVSILEPGEISTYREISKTIGIKNASRAVGNALGRNPFPLLIPCHRIIKTDLSLGGFNGNKDVHIKKELLKSEGTLLDDVIIKKTVNSRSLKERLNKSKIGVTLI